VYFSFFGVQSSAFTEPVSPSENSALSIFCLICFLMNAFGVNAIWNGGNQHVLQNG